MPSWMRAPDPSFRPDDRARRSQREVHDLDDLLAVDLAERAAEDGRVLAEHAHLPAVDRCRSR
jgi:hypothetical protein